jgi:hypothetical protein
MTNEYQGTYETLILPEVLIVNICIFRRREWLVAIQYFYKTIWKDELTFNDSRCYGFLFVVSPPFKIHLFRFWRFAHSTASSKTPFTNGWEVMGQSSRKKCLRLRSLRFSFVSGFYVCTRCNMQLAEVIKNIYDFVIESYNREEKCNNTHSNCFFFVSQLLIELIKLSLYLTCRRISTFF